MLTNIYSPPAEGNFCDNNGNALKPAIVEDYNCTDTWAMWTKETEWQILNTISHKWKWTRKLYFHLLDQANLNSYILSSSCGKKISHMNSACV
jgi:hypothetical protein